MTKTTSRVRRVTVESLPPNFGQDRNKELVLSVGVAAGKTLISLKPIRSRKDRELSITAEDLYHYLVRCEANRRTLERARSRKAKRAEQRERDAIRRAEKRLVSKPRPKRSETL